MKLAGALTYITLFYSLLQMHYLHFPDSLVHKNLSTPPVGQALLSAPASGNEQNSAVAALELASGNGRRSLAPGNVRIGCDAVGEASTGFQRLLPRGTQPG